MKRRLVKILKFLGLALVALVVVLAIAAIWFVRRPWAQTDGSLAVAGLTAPVQVIRDEWGVPQIYAANEHDLFFAQGYTHAQDRLWQMEFNRHVSGGRLSELFGLPVLSADKALRTFGLRREAERELALMSPETRAILDAYAQGVNAYLASHRGRLPVEFTLLSVVPEPWTPLDSVAWSKMMALSLGQNHTMEIMRMQLTAKLGPDGARQLLPPYPDGEGVIISPQAGGYGAANAVEAGAVPPILASYLGPPASARGSNNWVVSGSRTATGHPLLANDTHLGLNMPSEWYENGLHAGRFEVTGFSFPGVPLVLIGHNRRIAWGISNMCGDTQDLYVEEMNDRRQVKVNGEWRDAKIIHETIKARGANPVIYDVVVTPHGALVNEANELKGMPPLALRWTVSEPGRLLDSVAQYDTAGDWASFRQALSMWGAPTLNFVYADVDGNIGYQGAGLIPVRAPGQDGLAPVPADAPDRDWKGFIPFDQMPSLYNPKAGFIVTANNKVVADNYPHLIAHDYADPYRARRITELLAANPRVSVDDMRRLQAETFSPPAAALRPYLLAAVKPENDRERKALDLVRSWDLHFTQESAGATVYFAWFTHLVPDIMGDDLGDELMKAYRGFGVNQTPMYVELMKTPDSPWFDDKRTKDKVETRDDILRRAFHEAVDQLAKLKGDDPAAWRWGTFHTAIFSHQPFGDSGIAPLIKIFNGKPVPLSGESFSIDAMSPRILDPYRVSFGPSQRLIVDLGDLSRSLAVNSTGQNAQIFHRHREDQTDL
ncbi:MAG TPA: penicillin acylase family protein, partial [Thermoanaerobaculia bacterium]|nr:penicillin acylase family protein [Thermoanaerobaculia bacterium]